jgi:hypothetical protein
MPKKPAPLPPEVEAEPVPVEMEPVTPADPEPEQLPLEAVPAAVEEEDLPAREWLQSWLERKFPAKEIHRTYGNVQGYYASRDTVSWDVYGWAQLRYYSGGSPAVTEDMLQKVTPLLDESGFAGHYTWEVGTYEYKYLRVQIYTYDEQPAESA